LSRQLVSTRKAVVTCDATGDRQVNLLFEARWVRFTRGGWYQTGGRLLDVLPQGQVPTVDLSRWKSLGSRGMRVPHSSVRSWSGNGLANWSLRNTP
jgi:hypothetical protein